MRILVVEDAPHVRQFLTTGLRAEGHEVEPAADLAEARAVMHNQPVDFVIVDRMLPDGDGLDLVRAMRRAGSAVPTICLTGRDRVDERIEGLRSGVDDYLVKPFSFEELLARIEAVGRRSGVSDTVSSGPVELDLTGRTVTLNGKNVELTSREFDLLVVFLKNEGKVVSRTRLLDQVWGIQHDPRTNVVDVYVRYLRNKLGPGLVHTVRSVGYVFDPKRGPHATDERPTEA